MPILDENTRVSAGYLSPVTGTTYLVNLTKEHAEIGGFSSVTPAVAPLPRRFTMMKIHGRADNGRRASIPIGSLGALSAYITTGSFLWDGDDFAITGYTLEKATAGSPSI